MTMSPEQLSRAAAEFGTPLYLYDHGDAETEKCMLIAASIGAILGSLLPRLVKQLVQNHSGDEASPENHND